MQPGASAASYDRTTIVLHWLTALLVAGLWLAGQTIDAFPNGAPRIIARSCHIVFGAALGLLLVYRIFWRASSGRRLPAADGGLLGLAGTAAHHTLYLLLVAAIVSGVANTLVRGDNLFNWYSIASIAPGNRALRGQIGGAHELIVNLLLLLALLHAAAALAHRFVWRDSVLARMWPPHAR